MKLDVLVPTFNRAESLQRLLESLLRAPVPSSLSLKITVIDNNCTDATQATVQAMIARAGDRLQLTSETQQGRSSALNRGIGVTNGDLVAMVDDDEEIDDRWFHVIATAFADPSLDYIGGPYIPRWQTAAPEWLPAEYGGVIGWVESGASELPYDASFPGILMGGNAVVRRRVFDRIGPYAPWLGRTGTRLLSGEDRDFYDRLVAAGAKGRYLPSLIVHHHVNEERCTKEYFRRWLFWHGVSLGMLEREQPSTDTLLLGIPRWRFRSAARGASAAVVRLFRRSSDAARAFAAELQVWEFLGMMYGRHVYRRGKLDRGSPQQVPAA